MAQKPEHDWIIIGTGLAGLTTAVELVRVGINPLVLARVDDVMIATKACHGISTTKGILESDSELFAAKLKGHRGFFGWLQSIEQDLCLSRPPEVAMFGVREKFSNLEQFKKNFGRIYRRDFTGAKAVRVALPATDKSSDNSSWMEAFYPQDWWVDPDYVVGLLKQFLLKYQVKFENFEVDAVAINQSKGRSVESIELREKTGRKVTGNHVVCCAGAGTSKIFHQMNEISFSDRLIAVPGFTFKAFYPGESFCLVKETNGVTKKGSQIFWGSSSEPASEFVAGKWNIGPSMSQEGVNELGMQMLKSFGKPIDFSYLLQTVSRWGVRVRTKDRYPIFKELYRTEASSLWLNTGYYKSGIILSWLKARDFASKISSTYHHSRA